MSSIHVSQSPRAVVTWHAFNYVWVVVDNVSDFVFNLSHDFFYCGEEFELEALSCCFHCLASCLRLLVLLLFLWIVLSISRSKISWSSEIVPCIYKIHNPTTQVSSKIGKNTCTIWSLKKFLKQIWTVTMLVISKRQSPTTAPFWWLQYSTSKVSIFLSYPLGLMQY